MSSGKRQIGFSSQKIRYEWLTKTANLKLAGIEQDQIRAEILEYLADWLPESGATNRSSRDKAATILLRTWVCPDTHLHEMRDAGLKLLRTMSPHEQRSIHWGMIMASYHYWGDVADAVGRLLRLQDIVETAQIQRRIKESYGDREVVSRATRNVVNNFVDWRVLYTKETKGVYFQPESQSISDVSLIAWLAEAVLRSQEKKAIPSQELLGSSRLFPFELDITRPEKLVAHSARLELLRHGLDDTLIMLKES